MRIQSKMLLMINKMLLTHTSIIRITLAQSLKAFGTQFRIGCLTTSSCDSESTEKAILF